MLSGVFPKNVEREISEGEAVGYRLKCLERNGFAVMIMESAFTCAKISEMIRSSRCAAKFSCFAETTEEHSLSFI